jgi:hypothetical protein
VKAGGAGFRIVKGHGVTVPARNSGVSVWWKHGTEAVNSWHLTRGQRWAESVATNWKSPRNLESGRARALRLWVRHSDQTRMELG